MNPFRPIPLLFALLFHCTGVIAQPAHINFTSLGTRDGLLSNSISAIIKDRFGLMWFATNDGLNKFDGKNFVVYRHRPGDSTSLRSNEVLALHEDADGNLWVGTSGGALSQYDRKRDCFVNYPDDSGKGPGRRLGATALIRGLCSDRQGNIWIAQFQAPFILNPKTGGLKRLDLHRYAADPAAPISLLSIYEDNEGQIWVGTDNGLFQYISATKSFRQYLHVQGDSSSLPGNSVQSMCEDRQGDLWVGTDRGLCRFVAGQHRFVVFRERAAAAQVGLGGAAVGRAMAGRPATAGSVNAVSVDKDGYVWVGCGDGLVVIDPRSGRSVTYRPDEANSHSLTSEGITSIYIDPDGIYWIGTFRGGVNKYDKNLNLFDGKMGEAFRDGGVQSSVVTAFAERPDGNLFVTTDGGGLYLFDRKTGRLDRQAVVPDGKPVSPLLALALRRSRDNLLYIGTFNKGLLLYDPATGRTHRLETGGGAHDVNANSIYCIWEDKAGNIWTGTNGNGVSVLRDGKLRSRIVPNPELPIDVRLPVNGYIRTIAEDGDDNIWIGSHGDGVAVYNQQTGKFRVYSLEKGTLPSDKVQALLLDSKGRMWLGTNGGGLCMYDKARDRFIVYAEKDGLQNTNVYAVLEDDSGRIWVSTNSGISSLDVETGIFRNFTPYNGLQNNNFVHTSALKASDGELFFGGQQGFNYLYPSALTMNRNVPAVILTDLRVANKSVTPGRGASIDEQISIASDIRLDYRQNFALSFVALNYTLPDQNRYAYKLDGFDRDWIYSGGQNTAYYTNLDPGDYTFRVKASNNDGVWSRGDTTIHVHVRPPLWRTPVAYIIYVLLAGGLLFYSRHRGLERMRKKFAGEQERQAQELDRMKLKFLTNMSHEFRTPIALIMGPVEQLLSQHSVGAPREKLEMIRRNGRRLLNLVNQLLDFRKMEEQELRLQVSPGDLVDFAREIGHSFGDLSERKRINFRFVSNTDRLDVLFDGDKIERILFNLLSNAFKFTGEGGSIGLMVEAGGVAADGRQLVSIRVTDTGVGIPKSDQDRIFDRFFQHSVPGAILNQGTGIGLSITKEFVQMHGGTILVDSEPGRGSVFTVNLPLTVVVGSVAGGEVVVGSAAGGDVGEEQAAGDGESGNVANGGGGGEGSETEAGGSGMEEGEVQEEEGEVRGEEGEVDTREGGGLVGPGGRPRVLLVEDNQDFRVYLKDNLASYYDVLEAENGKEGWQLALSGHPELIVSDISMPYMDGIELTRKLKADKRTSHIPVILLTALAEEAQQLKGLGTGANDYITKPFSFELLNARMKGLLDWNSKLKTAYTKQVKVVVPVAEGGSGNEKLLLRIVGCLEAHLQDAQLSVEFLSRELGMSRSSLYAKVLEITGETPVEFIRSFRLEKAAVLLEKGSLSISEIAYEVGFTSPNYFTRAFKAKYKMLPSEYVGRTGSTKQG